MKLTLLFLFVVFASLTGCGGGGSGGETAGGGPFTALVLSWNPPATYQDGSPLNPASDLDNFEIYVKETAKFSDQDSEMATLSAIDKATGQVCTSFNLANLAPYISKGVTYHVSVRAVAKDGLKSSFSPSASFSF